MKLEALGDICEFLDHLRRPVSEELRKPGPYPYYGANGQQGWIDGFIFNEPLVLLAEDGGHFGSKTDPIAYKVSGKTWVNNHAHVLRPLPGCDLDYLTYALSLLDITKLINGTTRPKLTKGSAESIRIPFPDLAEQKRIAAILERADRLRRLRRYGLEMVDQLGPTIFLKLFGDPAQRNWPKKTLEGVVQPSRGITYGIVQAGPHVPDGVPYIRTGDIVDGQIRTEGLLRTSKEVAASYKRSEVKFGDLVFSIRATVGTVGLLPRALDGANLTQGTARIAPNGDVDKRFLLWQLRTREVQQWIRQQVKGSTFLEITLARLRELPVFVPPCTLQKKFAEVTKRHEKLTAIHREALRHAEHLFQTLLHRAFTSGL